MYGYVSKCDKSNEVKDWNLANIKKVDHREEVSKLNIFNEVKEPQPLNLENIKITFEVNQRLKYQILINLKILMKYMN